MPIDTTTRDAEVDASTDIEPADGANVGEGPLVTGELLVTEELLVEEVSIDGMCGVY